MIEIRISTSELRFRLNGLYSYDEIFEILDVPSQDAEQVIAFTHDEITFITCPMRSTARVKSSSEF